ncbi:hypothetical protein [Clostridium sp.]|uniref:hypothetical protein n=1 Tax=Clostridium sp. TaxID=1506 RepID=UPI0026326925|nr:hypothetical protein [Clostridium sp.]
MSYYEDKKFLGIWKYNTDNSILSIEKTGEVYKCLWKDSYTDDENKYLGIGIFVDNQLLISRYSAQVPGGGIGLYKPIGDLRSNSSLWASTQNPDILGSGIAIRENTCESFEGSYKVRYFIEGTESPVYDLSISKDDKNDLLYFLNWSLDEEVKLHGVGMVSNDQLILAWGGVIFDYELIILDIEDNRGNVILKSKKAVLGKDTIKEEILTK